jgi:hypothetical protein
MPHYRQWGGNKDNFRHEIEVNMIKTGDRYYCIIAEWANMEDLRRLGRL